MSDRASEIQTHSQENQHFNPITAVQSLVKFVQSTSPQFTKMYKCSLKCINVLVYLLHSNYSMA